MSEPFLGEIQQWGFDFAPVNTAFCNGQDQTIAQNTALFSLLGTQFGGDGRVTFKLPDLRGRVPVYPNFSTIPKQGFFGGVETVTLSTSEIGHRHTLMGASTDGNAPFGVGDCFANVGPNPVTGERGLVYGGAGNMTDIGVGAVSYVGGSQSHYNMQPFAVINFTIVLTGLYPQRS